METLKIVEYEPKHQPAFRALNEAWIAKYFRMEPQDYVVLDNPDTEILAPGGAILMVEYKGESVGTCALVKLSETRFELAKMAVSPKVQGKGFGYQLGLAIIAKAKSMNATSLYIESNTLLKPAMRVYEKLGFKEIPIVHVHYERCDIQMELDI